MSCMRLSILALIARKETRDLLRDRRTVLLIALAPLLLYPLVGILGWLIASELVGKPTVIGVVNGADAEMIASAKPFPPLFAGDKFADGLLTKPSISPPKLIPLEGDPDDALRSKRVQAVIVIPPNFNADLDAGKKPKIVLLNREGDERSKVAVKLAGDAIETWEGNALAVKFARDGKPQDYAEIITVEDPLKKPIQELRAESLRDEVVRLFPLLLVMWLVAGSMQPAVDLTAGEKERGTMETLLLSPAERIEIVLGKFIAVTIFGFGSVLWNVLCLSAAGFLGEQALGLPIINLVGMLGCLLMGVPIAMLFSAVALALGIFARSSKEGQYYLVPVFLVTMPLAFWTMIPGTELSLGNSIVPISGAMLLQQRLLAVNGDPIPWGYFVPVLGSLAVYIAIALYAAWWQFNRESVLFRETGPAKVSGGFFGLFSKAGGSKR